MDWKKYLEKIYYDPKHPASYSSPKKLLKAIRAEGRWDISFGKIKKWLSSQDTYTSHHPSRKRFKRNVVHVDGIDEQWDMDLMDMTYVSKHNDGYQFILVAIDIFSRYGWAVAIKSKKANDVLKGIEEIFDSTGRRPRTIRMDKGSEFVNAKVKTFLEGDKILHSVTQNEVKANYVERWIKTIKGRLSRYFQEKNTFAYLKILPDIVNSYNTYHRLIKRTPASVTEQNQLDLWQQMYVKPYVTKNKVAKKKVAKKKKKKKNPFRYKVGDTVRISHLRNVFTREYDQKWTGEVFTITRRLLRNDIPIYKVKDYSGEDIRGTFYQPELQKVDFDESNSFKIEKIVGRRGRGKNKQLKKRWVGWPKKYDQWLPETAIQRLGK